MSTAKPVFAVGDEVALVFDIDRHRPTTGAGAVASISKSGKKITTSTGAVAWRTAAGDYKVGNMNLVPHRCHTRHSVI